MDPERRLFLQQLSALSAALAAAPVLSGCRRESTSTVTRTFAAPERHTLEALVEHIIPADEEPGAGEAGCADFIELQMAKEEFQLRGVASPGRASSS